MPYVRVTRCCYSSRVVTKALGTYAPEPAGIFEWWELSGRRHRSGPSSDLVNNLPVGSLPGNPYEPLNPVGRPSGGGSRDPAAGSPMRDSRPQPHAPARWHGTEPACPHGSFTEAAGQVPAGIRTTRALRHAAEGRCLPRLRTVMQAGGDLRLSRPSRSRTPDPGGRRRLPGASDQPRHRAAPIPPSSHVCRLRFPVSGGIRSAATPDFPAAHYRPSESSNRGPGHRIRG